MPAQPTRTLYPEIVFGTDGWRGLIAKDFTFANVERVAGAAANYFKGLPKIKNGIVVGYDARFLSREFAQATSRVLAANGIQAHLTDRISSTPMVSLAVVQMQCAAGVIITASHNPAQYNGFKVKGAFGGPAHPEQIAAIETSLKVGDRMRVYAAYESFLAEGSIKLFDARKMYLDYLPLKIEIERIRAAGLRLLYDPMYGAGQQTMDAILPTCVQIHNEFNPSFGDIDHPEPMAECLGTLLGKMRDANGAFDIGIATDGDADRVGLVDEKGAFVDSHKIFMLLLKYLYEDKGLRGDVAKTVSLTSMVDAYCEKHKITVHETPVGFKYICKLMTEGNILVGGEESGGLGTSLHIPERDGIFNGLLVMEMMAARKKKLSELVAELEAEFGPHYYRRIDLHTTDAHKKAVLDALRADRTEIGPFRVTSINRRDGTKFIVDRGWALVRASGTEPLLRFYAEAESPAAVDAMLEAVMKL
jgi:phosphomannomutase